MVEIWKDVPGYIGVYQVSNLGHVRSLTRYIPRCNNTLRISRGRILKSPPNKEGYPQVCLYSGSRETGKSVRISHLVVLAFIGPRPSGMDVCHNDGNPKNNKLSNLRYGTRVSNCADRVLHGTHREGEKIYNAKLTDADVLHIRKLASTVSYEDLAIRFNVGRSNISNICAYRRWKHIP